MSRLRFEIFYKLSWFSGADTGKKSIVHCVAYLSGFACFAGVKFVMGPITIFDKSFLQSLNIDEAVLFDHFFLSNICPIYFLETLADLEKTVIAGRSPEEEVRILSAKTPQHGKPNMFHTKTYTGNLLGHEVPIGLGQIIVSGGKPVKTQGQTGI